MTFGEKIQALRKEAGISQEELSAQLDVSRQSVSKWENDKGYPETDKILKMGKLFGVTADYLLNDENTSKTEPGQNRDEILVSDESAEKFLTCQFKKYRTVAMCCMVLLAAVALVILFGTIGVVIYLVIAVAMAALMLFTLFRENPYRAYWKGHLLLGDTCKQTLQEQISNRRSTDYAVVILGGALITLGLLVMPVLSTLLKTTGMGTRVLMAVGMVAAGAGVYSCAFRVGMMRVYRKLLRG